MKSKLKIYRIPREDGSLPKLPQYAHDTDACFDIFANNQENIIVPAKQTVLIPTGLVMEPAPGYSIELHNRSSVGSKSNVQLSHCVGIVDNPYRGELLVPLYNRGNRTFVVTPEMKICQAKIVEDIIAEFEEVAQRSDLSETTRGEGGFGSSGK